MYRRYFYVTYYHDFTCAEVDEKYAVSCMVDNVARSLFTIAEREEMALKKLRGAKNGDILHTDYTRKSCIIVVD